MKKLFGIFMGSSAKRNIVLVVFDILCFIFVDTAFYLVSRVASRSMPVDYINVFIINSLVQLVLVMAARFVLDVYRNVWRYGNTRAYLELLVADTTAGLFTLLLARIFGTYVGMWQAVIIGSLTALVALSSRFAYSMFHVYRSSPKRNGTEKTPVAIVGAGRLGSYLADDLHNNPNSVYDPMFYIDNDPSKSGNRISGMEVYGSEMGDELIKQFSVKTVIIAIKSKTADDMSNLYYHYVGLGCNVKVFDSLVSDKNGELPRNTIREFKIEDLLFREPIDITSEQSYRYYTNKTVLVTGGGGSIGSEICRQIAKCYPKKLIIYDIYENNAYDIQQELISEYGDKLDLTVLIGSVRDKKRLDAIFSEYRPDVVFHAAAHKHVPLMENSPMEAIKNNVMGTYNVADMAEKYGVEKFILVSTDKAVNPTNVMGASKRICEMVIQCRKDSKTSFAAVRFGNVLGSNGSVIPLFKKQIAAGGPVTVTDKRIIRYFMTIPEASQLVIQAGAMAKAGELFVLDMGKPVKIYDLAADMIRLSGFEPEKDIKIQEIGLRPGEKLYEELLMKCETLEKTENNLIFIERDTAYTRAEVEEKLAILNGAVSKCAEIADVFKTRAIIKDAIKSVVPTFHEPEELNSSAEKTNEFKMANV